MLVSQDVQPRVYTPAPVGVNMGTAAYSFSTGAILYDKTLPVENVTADVHSVVGAYSRSIGMFGMSSRVDLVLPFVTGDWVGELSETPQSSSRTGIADPTARLALFVIGAPALSKEEFADFEPRTTVGVTARVRFPLGQYESDQLINLGSNRWVLSPQVGVTQVAGRFLFEAYAAAWFFSDNDEFLGNRTLSQEPLYAFQLHAVYRFDSGLWIAASTRQSFGGATQVDDGDELAPESNNRVGLTVSVPVGRQYMLKFAATTGLTTQVGNDYTTLSAAFQIVF